VHHIGILPDYLFVSGVLRIGRNPLVGGGCADIWKGKFKGEPVALKVLRIFGDSQNSKKILHVNMTFKLNIYGHLTIETGLL